MYIDLLVVYFDMDFTPGKFCALHSDKIDALPTKIIGKIFILHNIQCNPDITICQRSSEIISLY